MGIPHCDRRPSTLPWKEDDGKWHRQDVDFVKAARTGRKGVGPSNKRETNFYKTKEAHAADDTFYLLRRLVRRRALLGASISSGSGEVKRTDGLVAGHAYSVLDARSFKDKDSPGGRLNLVQLRNPLGGHEWNGAWSDDHPFWDAKPSVKRMIRPTKAEDGSFWMDFTDFNRCFNGVDVCQRGTGVQDLSLDVLEADGCAADCAGPCLGCMGGCTWFWCCCRGCNALYCNDKARKKTVEIGAKGRDDDVLDFLELGLTSAIVPESIQRFGAQQ